MPTRPVPRRSLPNLPARRAGGVDNAAAVTRCNRGRRDHKIMEDGYDIRSGSPDQSILLGRFTGCAPPRGEWALAGSTDVLAAPGRIDKWLTRVNISS
ncbi:hypothetical protein GCM10012279_29100 [Micromonospora yangpuensis]|nr:hypothetical protein GCM10012279_29100 [Micromonospora yangpuensis]